MRKKKFRNKSASLKVKLPIEILEQVQKEILQDIFPSSKYYTKRVGIYWHIIPLKNIERHRSDSLYCKCNPIISRVHYGFLVTHEEIR